MYEGVGILASCAGPFRCFPLTFFLLGNGQEGLKNSAIKFVKESSALNNVDILHVNKKNLESALRKDVE
jgi:hypothetical protein